MTRVGIFLYLVIKNKIIGINTKLNMFVSSNEFETEYSRELIIPGIESKILHTNTAKTAENINERKLLIFLLSDQIKGTRISGSKM